MIDINFLKNKAYRDLWGGSMSGYLKCTCIEGRNRRTVGLWTGYSRKGYVHRGVMASKGSSCEWFRKRPDCSLDR